MRPRLIVALTAGLMLLAGMPARSAAVCDPMPPQSDPTYPLCAHIANVSSYAQRIPPGNPGEKRSITLIYGPFVIPPGWDKNQFTVDVPIQTGFYTKVFPNLIDVKTGHEPTEQDAHIHHAHWFRVVKASDGYESYEEVPGVAELSWVFGTGEERTGGTLDDRTSPQEGWKYGIFLDGSTPQVLIFMIHNKTASPMSAYITLSIDMVYGTRQQIMRATGQDIHPLTGVLTGTTQDTYPRLINWNSDNGVLREDYTADMSGTLVAAGSHMHPGGKWVYVTNLGPQDANGNFICHAPNDPKTAADLDGDGIPGTTLFVSRKFDQVAQTWPYSEDYQMGGTQGGFRAPIHQGDVIRQFGVYDVNRPNAGDLPLALFRTDPLDTSPASSSNTTLSIDGQDHAWYAAMSYTGLYVDEYNKPALAQGVSAADCVASTFAPKLIPSDGFNSDGTSARDVDGVGTPMASSPYAGDPRATFLTHPWLHIDAVCNAPDGLRNGTFPCEDKAPITYVDGQTVTTIHVANFAYIPGDLNYNRNLDGTVSVPLVKLGSQLTFVNEDVALGLRHTFTSCPRPCEGDYVANYPLPDGRFESGKLGNLDYIDGGLDPNRDMWPYKTITIDPQTYQAGQIYPFFCSIHPWMRGAFKVVA